MFFSSKQKILLATVLFAVSGIWLYSFQMVTAHEAELRSVNFSQDVTFSFPDNVYEEMQIWFRKQGIVLANATTVREPFSYSPEVIVDYASESVFSSTTTAVATPATVAFTLESLVDNVKIEDTEDILSEAQERHYKELLSTVFVKFPSEMVSHLDFLTLRSVTKGSRGLAGANSMILRVGGKLSDKEIVAVAIHEFGHIVDLGYFTGNTFSGASTFKDGSKVIYNDDKSLQFYQISWINDTTLKDGMSEDNFVSGYADSDPFEDYAETFIYYVLHGKQFKKMTEYNNVLSQKYTYMKDTVFGGKEFLSNNESVSLNYGTARPWDATLEKYDYDEFLELSFK